MMSLFTMLSFIFVFNLLHALNVFAIDSDEWKLIFKAATGGKIKEKYIFLIINC